jgi:hypothetical protein
MSISRGLNITSTRLSGLRLNSVLVARGRMLGLLVLQLGLEQPTAPAQRLHFLGMRRRLAAPPYEKNTKGYQTHNHGKSGGDQDDHHQGGGAYSTHTLGLLATVNRWLEQPNWLSKRV